MFRIPPALLLLFVPLLTAEPQRVQNDIFQSPEDRSRLLQWTGKHFPDYLKKSSGEFGWRIHVPGRGWQQLPAALSPHNAAILMQGLDDTGKTWMNLAPALSKDGWTVLELRYPNDQPILNSTAYLFDEMLHLQNLGVESFVLIGHSMGGLISRALLSLPVFNYRHNADIGAFPRCRYLIQIGSPNHGSGWARLRILSEWREHAYKFSKGRSIIGGLMDGNGEAGRDLLPGSAFLRQLNAHPLPDNVPVTVIAGVVAPVSAESLRDTWALWKKRKATLTEDQEISPEQIWNLSALFGDGAVPLQSTRIDNVSDYHIFHASHLFLIRNISLKSTRIPPAVPVIRRRLRTVYQPKVQKK